MTKDAPLHFRTITEIAVLIESRQVSPLELTNYTLDRIYRLDGLMKSYATVMADRALSAAKVAEQEIQRGRYLGPLHGVPIAVKDLCFTTGVRTMGGTRVLADHIPEFDASVVTKLEAAGALLLGKLNTTEGAMAAYHPEFGIPVNPWDSERWPGASSSGSGVATAAGLCFASIGSDTGGSIRFPAASCGTVGLKPTWGRVSRYGVLPLAESMDHVGPLARSSADAGIMLQAIAGFDRNDPTSLSDTIPNVLEGIDGGVKGVRIGIDHHYISRDVDGEVAEAVLHGVRLLEGQGAEIVEVKIPEMEEFLSAWPILCAVEAVTAHEATYPSRRDEYGPWFRDWLDLGIGTSAVAFSKANNLRAASNGLLHKLFEEIDVMACPTMPTTAFEISPSWGYGPMDEPLDMSFLRFTAPFNFNGAPTLSVPSGLSNEGLPLSLQFVGRHLQEKLLCRIGYTYEQAAGQRLPDPHI